MKLGMLLAMSEDNILHFTPERLNQLVMGHMKFDIEEEIVLNEFGGGRTTITSNQAVSRVSANDFDNEMKGALVMLRPVEVVKFRIAIARTFTTLNLESFRAEDRNGNELQINQKRDLGGTALEIPLELEMSRDQGDVKVTMPEYRLTVTHSRISAKVGKLWLLQWTHGASGEQTAYKLTLKLPELRRGLKQQITSSAFSEFYPQISKAKGDRTFEWHATIPGQTSFSIYAIYGTQLRKSLFSPLGFILTTLAAIALTLLAQPYIEKMLQSLRIT